MLVLTTNNYVFFAVTFWGYLTTRSVITTSFLGGIYLVLTAVSGFWFGSIVDHHKKKHALLGSSIGTLALFTAGLALFQTAPAGAFASVSSVRLWAFMVLLTAGTLAGAIYNIAIPTLTAFLIGPIAHFTFIPFMTTGAGVHLIGDWFGTGVGRGIALVFSAAGLIGLAVTLVAMRSRAYRLLAERYREAQPAA